MGAVATDGMMNDIHRWRGWEWSRIFAAFVFVSLTDASQPIKLARVHPTSIIDQLPLLKHINIPLLLCIENGASFQFPGSVMVT
jgi:hypothetical protein